MNQLQKIFVLLSVIMLLVMVQIYFMLNHKGTKMSTHTNSGLQDRRPKDEVIGRENRPENSLTNQKEQKASMPMSKQSTLQENNLAANKLKDPLRMPDENDTEHKYHQPETPKMKNLKIEERKSSITQQTTQLIPHVNPKEEEYFKPRPTDVNHVHFSFLLSNPLICQWTKPYLLFLIHSTAKNFQIRDTIRSTWVGSLRNRTWVDGRPLNYPVAYVFLLGNSTDVDINNAVTKENEKYGDIVQFGFTETYRNTIYKSYMGLRWFRGFCQQTSFVVKIDEDVFVHVPNILSYLHNQTVFPTNPIDKTIFGRLSGNNMVYRSPKWFKWAVSFEDYPLSHYPSHASGGIYFMSSNVAMALINMADYIPLVHIEDAFFCGILRKVLGFSVVTPDLHLMLSHIHALCWFAARKLLIALHPVGYYNMNLLWQRLPFVNSSICTVHEKEFLQDIYKDEYN